MTYFQDIPALNFPKSSAMTYMPILRILASRVNGGTPKPHGHIRTAAQPCSPQMRRLLMLQIIVVILMVVCCHGVTLYLKTYVGCTAARASLTPRSQPAVRATALACLVLRRSYVSNSASPAADWGLKVILQPPYRQRTSLVAAVPPTHRIARRKSHSEGTFNVLAPCHRPRVRTAVCVSVSQWHGAGEVRWRHHSHILPTQSIYSELITGLPEKFIFNLTKHGKNTSVNMAWYPRRLELLRLHLVAEGQRRQSRFDILDSISSFFCILTYAIIYVLIHHIIFGFIFTS